MLKHCYARSSRRCDGGAVGGGFGILISSWRQSIQSNIRYSKSIEIKHHVRCLNIVLLDPSSANVMVVDLQAASVEVYSGALAPWSYPELDSSRIDAIFEIDRKRSKIIEAFDTALLLWILERVSFKQWVPCACESAIHELISSDAFYPQSNDPYTSAPLHPLICFLTRFHFVSSVNMELKHARPQGAISKDLAETTVIFCLVH